MKYMLIDVTTTEETKIIKVGSLKAIQLLGQIEKLNGRQVIAPPVEGRGFSKLERLPLQYLYWHLMQQTPPDDYAELCKRALAAVEALPVDNTPHDELQATINRLTPASTPMTTGEPGDAPKSPRQISERPKGTSVTGRVWEIADECLGGNAIGTIDIKALRAEIMKRCEAEGIHSATAATQYSKWKGSKIKS